MGNTESLQRSKSDRQTHPDSNLTDIQTSSQLSESSTSSPGHLATPSKHPAPFRSQSVPNPRNRHNSETGSHYSHSAYSSSLEGGYSDNGDGMSPTTFGGNYKKTVPRVNATQSFNAAHGYKLTIPIDSKQGSGFDLDWQYDPKTRNRVVAQRSLNPDHPLYHKLTPKIVEEGPTSAPSVRQT